MSAIDALLAELAAAEMAYLEYIRERRSIERALGRQSFEWYQHDNDARAWKRRNAAQDAITAYALTWAAERADEFIKLANDTPLVQAIDDAFAPLARMK